MANVESVEHSVECAGDGFFPLHSDVVVTLDRLSQSIKP